jgi:hypothetical protein
MTSEDSPPREVDAGDDEGLARIVDEQIELAAAKLPPLAPGLVHPSPADHAERAAGASLDDVLLGNALAPAEMLDDLAVSQAGAPLSDDEFVRQALADGGADRDPATPE